MLGAGDVEMTAKTEAAAALADATSDRPLNQLIKHSIILAYEEDVSPLSRALEEEGLHPTTQRASYTEEELAWPRAVRLFHNHRAAWQRAMTLDGYTLICESDYDPCIGMGTFPSFWPLSDPLAFGYLYAGSPRLLALVSDKPYLRAHCSPLVSYVVNAAVARILCDFFRDEIERYGTQTYFTFDSHLQWFAMGKGASAFIPMKNYGEHGGFPNPEHAVHGSPRAGQHRADNLAGPLHFLPQYSRGSVLRYLFVRAHSRLLGLGRLLANKWLFSTSVYHHDTAAKARMYGVGLLRLLPSSRPKALG
ncbi:hypothetical protein BH11PSE3_BH11PSE3_18530 [soil metagenome]